jgi:anti-anti-sigma factor
MLKPAVQIHNEDGILVAEFWDCWRLDPAPVQDLRAHYEAHLNRGGRPEVVVDLSGVGFAGSAALGNFVALHRTVRQKGGRILFCNVEPTVSEVFRASKLESLFDFAADRAAGVRAIREGPASGANTRKPAENDQPGQDRAPKPARSGVLRRRHRNPDSGPTS